jgi:hypothetical protein
LWGPLQMLVADAKSVAHHSDRAHGPGVGAPHWGVSWGKPPAFSPGVPTASETRRDPRQIPGRVKPDRYFVENVL